MQKRERFLAFFLLLVVVIGFAHLFAHMIFFGPTFFDFSGKNIAGLAVDNSQVDGKTSMKISYSEIILFLEWGLIFLGIIFVYAKHKVELNKEYHTLKALKEKKHFSKGTELDNFYELLREMKHFRLSTAARVFDVDDEVVESWARSLEAGRLAVLTYPRIGGPEIMIKEEQPKEGKLGFNNSESNK